MTTDPLCPQQHTHPKHDPNRCIFCEYGGAVREDERGKVNPPTPFPMGAKVRGVGGTRVLTVTGWGFYPALGKWFVRVETGEFDEEGEREYALMYLWELELVTYEQGQRDERERWEAEGPWFKSVVHQCCEDKETAYAKGRTAGLDAATEAVALLLRSWGRVTDPEAEDMILAAIAALKEQT